MTNNQMKKLVPVNLVIDCDMDADDLGHRLVQCVNNMDLSSQTVNLIKVNVGDVTSDAITKIIGNLRLALIDMGVTNCVLVPIKNGFINDVSIEYVKVKNMSDDEFLKYMIE